MFDLPPETYRLLKVEKKRGTNRGRFDLIGISGEGAFPSSFTSETPPRGDDSFTGRQPPPTEPDIERPPDGNAGAPENLVGTWDAGDVLLVWEHTTPGGDFVFVVERSEDGGSYDSVQVLDSSTLMMVDTPVFGVIFAYRVKTVNSVGSSDYSNVVSFIIGARDSFESYASDLSMTGLDEGLAWSNSWLDYVLFVGVQDEDSFESYDGGISVDELSQGEIWGGAWVDINLYVGVHDEDSFESYGDDVDLDALSAGLVWGGAWVDINLYAGVTSLESFESYADDTSLTDLNSGTGFAGAWVDIDLDV